MDVVFDWIPALRLLVAASAWLIWWQRRGRARRALSVALSVWAILGSALVIGNAPWSMIVLFDSVAAVWLVFAIAPRRPELSALYASEAKFAAAFRHSLDSVILTAVPSGEVLEVNHGFTLITGIPREDAIGRTTLELDLWADLDDRRRMMEALQRDGRIRELAADFNRVDRGGIRHGLLWGELIQIQDATCLLTVVRDVTEARQRQRERAELIDELERKNQELERFAYTVAHDLRNPLVSIQGFVDLARDDWRRGDLDEVPDHLLRISGGAERLQDLLDSLLELSRAGQVIDSPRAVDLREIVDEALDALSSAVRGSGATILVEDDLPTVCADRTRLGQVIQNLLANALGCLGDQPRPEISIGARRDEHRSAMTFFVRDNGHGIPSDQLESIFRLFERGTTPSEGTGIGLALVRQIIEGHGGEVWAESDGAGRGATFCFTLPTPPAC